MKNKQSIFFTFLFVLTLLFSQGMMAQEKRLNDEPNFGKYEESNYKVVSEGKEACKVVFIGNSITEGWVTKHPEFFTTNGYIGRGIGGQTSPQLLLRFRADVVDLQPRVVVIGIGTNDIAENTGKYKAKFTIDNIRSMGDIATANGIKVVIISVLPAGEYPWNKSIVNVPEKIDALNVQLKIMAERNGYKYVDFNTPMRTDKGALQAHLTNDGVHVTTEGYDMMEAIIKPVLDKLVDY